MRKQNSIIAAALMTAAMASAPSIAMDVVRTANDQGVPFSDMTNEDVSAAIAAECPNIYSVGKVYTRCFDELRDQMAKNIEAYRAALPEETDYNGTSVAEVCEDFMSLYVDKVKAHQNMFVREIHNFTYGAVNCARSLQAAAWYDQIPVSDSAMGAFNVVAGEAFANDSSAVGFPTGIAAGNLDRLGYYPTAEEMGFREVPVRGTPAGSKQQSGYSTLGL